MVGQQQTNEVPVDGFARSIVKVVGAEVAFYGLVWLVLFFLAQGVKLFAAIFLVPYSIMGVWTTFRAIAFVAQTISMTLVQRPLALSATITVLSCNILRLSEACLFLYSAYYLWRGLYALLRLWI